MQDYIQITWKIWQWVYLSTIDDMTNISTCPAPINVTSEV